MGDEDFFSDDDLDHIPDTTLRDLEHNALTSTQRPKAGGQTSRDHYGIGLKKGGSNVSALSAALPAGKSHNRPWCPPQPQAQPTVPPAPRAAPPASAPAPPSSDYGLDDEEDVIDLDEPSMVIQPASGPHAGGNVRPRPSTALPARYGSKPVLDREAEAAFAAADVERGAQSQAQWAHAPHLQPRAGDGMDLSALQARVAELEGEQARLRQAEQAARNAAATKQGEIAIVRSNQEKAAKEYERRIAVMQKLHADEAARVKAELEANKKEREKMETDNRFLQHDLNQEAERAKRLIGPGKARTTGPGREKDTPRKNRRTALGDGFDDVEVLLISPSKSREKAKDSTPKHEAKRKRTASDSPAAALSFTQPPAPVRQESSIEQPAASAEQPRTTVRAADKRYEFMQRLLNHSPSEGQERSIETLAKYHLPSRASQSLSSALLDELAYPVASEQTDYLPLKLSRAVLKLWSQCLDDKYHSPLYLLLDLLDFAMYLELATIRSQLIEQAVPLCVRTVDLIATPTMRASTNPTSTSDIDRAAQDQLADELCADEVIDLLLQLCDAATLCAGRLEAFWKHMDLRFTLLMLNKAQPVHQVNAILRILATSALSTTFGPISDNVEAQPAQETGIIDRLTSLLVEMPEAPTDEDPYTESEIVELRLHILRVLKALCQTDHGGLLLAQHRSAIGRLIRFIDGQLNKLYTLTPTLARPLRKTDDHHITDAASPPHPAPTAHTLVAHTINLATRLFYHLLRTHDDLVDLTQKLHVIHGGHQKFLVAMSRLAFSEQLVLEYGIEDEVLEAAHSVLDSWLSPEEGEAVVRAVETPRGSRGSREGKVGGGRGGERGEGENGMNGDGREEVDGEGDSGMGENG
ncbi:hypothetical protein LTR91_001931 [Friedmanniomyces endolithicus]|uniref:DNA repair protein Rad26 n=1 Tax=Friedmanniomyces endolithicus TaxID=329885 RepID=A0AAN6KZ59_9PEZI|nr:hypothetical protein LTR59_000529 [Friedmanniomyces endolithicus]KAK0818244.1 hypothetical protein LTR38_001291 [Friedmanniomyces endolithicus]KAK0819418.1 hypothetical protein LTR75_002187 [Friedmanniomyces endolithicus]KAK0878966.1 hypothetical protein LTR87_007161 [Friedmanniomyces endolithicus]KAK0927916.1 hypothetical protein LTR57_003159 [Friedmanniomyces endolithicus]